MRGKRLLSAMLVTALTAGFGQAAQASYSDDEIRIGVMTGMRGISGMGSVVAAELAAEDMGGAINGRRIRIIGVDHKENLERAQAEAERLRKEHNIDALADMIGSNIAIALQKYATENNIAALQTTSATTKLTDELCSPVAVHWNYNSYALVTGAVNAMVDRGLDEWYFVSVDYALGDGLTGAAQAALEQAGGKTVGVSKHPFRTKSMATELLEAQASGAKVIALANAGADTVTAIREMYDLGIIGGDQTVLALLNTVTTIRTLGVYATNGLVFNTGFYWNHDEGTRNWSERFMKRQGYVPNMHHASTYSAVLHYLKAAREAGTDEARTVVAKMKQLPIEDSVFRNSELRPDGRMVHDMALAQVKEPIDVKLNGDYLRVLKIIPHDKAFRPLQDSKCPLL